MEFRHESGGVAGRFIRLIACVPCTHSYPQIVSTPLKVDSSKETSNGGDASQAMAFVTTHWSVVLSAQEKNSPRSAAALETLCRTYWYPLYAFVRRQSRNAEDAQDLVQEFFARLLEKDYLKSVAQEKGKFRTFLLVAFKRFLANAWDRQHARKRGGFTPILSIDQATAESRFAAELADSDQPDSLFDRHWAMTLLEGTMKLLQDEYVSTGRARLFESLKDLLVKEDSRLPYSAVATGLNLTEAAVKMAVHRLRLRYREILKAQIAQTVSSPQEVEEEIRHLFAAFGP
jgi:RNA polymerase sigma-70 factor (ECF subfamily)